MTISVHALLTAIGCQLHAGYLTTLAKPLPTGLKNLVVRLERFIEVRLKNRIFDPYRPELHYMRGPGPKWREKHAH